MANPAAPHTMIGFRYQLFETIGHGGMGVVYRALDRLSGLHVALKRVTAQAGTPSAMLSTSAGVDHRTLLATEFQYLASLRHPNIISVLDYGFDTERSPYFTMELLNAQRTIVAVGQNAPFETQIDLIVQLLQAMRYLHRRGIIHRDLKPTNILVRDDQVKVLDFGLSVSQGDHDPDSATTVGTLAYIAPEILQGGAASIQSDLWGVGVIAHEILMGKHPFDTSRLTQMLDQIKNTQIQFAHNQLQPQVAKVLERLLYKFPEARYHDAGTVLEDLSKALNKPFARDTEATRESFIQAAHFVGRTVELNQLSEGLREALNGKGSAWLIGGENGVGKSRLLNELRTQGMVRGAQVIRGQAVADTPYKVWRASIRHLALAVQITDFEAAVLKEALPEIEGLIGRSVAPVHPLDPVAAQTRFFVVMEDVLKRHTSPLLLILEDLHWAGTESIALLVWLTQKIATLPVMVVGSYRDEERSDLPKMVPLARLIRLNRLSETEIANLSQSMLGKGGQDPELLQLLQRETEGNAFFLVEVVRALAEEAGQLDKVGEMSLPKRVITGGVAKVLERRCSQLQDDHLPLLEQAAAVGRVLDLGLLARLRPHHNLEGWITECANAAIVEFVDGRWRFSHDRLRDHLLGTMTPERRRQVHREVAETIERSGSLDADNIPALAHHWGVVGDVDKEQHYAALAGEHALKVGANQEALHFFKRALMIGTTGGASSAQKAHWMRALGEAYYRLGDSENSVYHLRLSLEALGFPEPKGRRPIARSLLRNLLIQLNHRLRRISGSRTIYESEHTRRLEAARAYRELAEVYYFSEDAIMAIHATIRGLNIGEQARPSAELAQSYADMVVAMGVLRQRRLAQVYMRRARTTANHIEDALIIAHVKQRVGLYFIGAGDFAPAHADFEDGIVLYDQIGERLARARSMGALTMCKLYMGQLEAAYQSAQTYYLDAVRRNDELLQGWGLVTQATAAMYRGLNHQAIDLSFEALDRLKIFANPIVEMRSCGILALTYARMEHYDLARQYADRGLRVGANLSPSIYASTEGIVSVARAYVKLLHQAPADREALIALSHEANRHARRYAKKFIFGLPAVLRCEGNVAYFSDDPQMGQKCLMASLERARKLKMPYEEAMTLADLGGWLPEGNPERLKYLETAREMLNHVRAEYDHKRLEALLGGKPLN